MSVITNSIDYKTVSIQDLIWIETAFFMYKEKAEQFDLGIKLDQRILLKDISDSFRIKLAGNTKSIIKETDLPSYKLSHPTKPEEKDDIRKAFLKDLQKRTNNIFKNK